MLEGNTGTAQVQKALKKMLQLIQNVITIWKINSLAVKMTKDRQENAVENQVIK